jgi:hypothetical protein
MRRGWLLLVACASASAGLGAMMPIAFADEKSPPIAARPVGSSEPYWLTYAAFRNDVFTELDPPIDDFGFTHDNVFALRRQAGTDTFGGSFVHRFITSRQDRRRWDLIEVFATGERSFALDRISLAATLRTGPTLGGNFGGRYMQNGWHAISKTGPTVDEGLANNYPDDRELGFVVGGRARASISAAGADTSLAPARLSAAGADTSIARALTQAYSFVDGQFALGGTGVTSMQAALGGNLASEHLGAHIELAIARYHVGDPNLALPGAYRTGWQFEWRVGVDVHWSRFRLGYEYRANESGSGEPMGLLEVSTTR